MVQTAAGMSGIFLGSRSLLRTAVSLTVLGSIGTLFAQDVPSHMQTALLAFGAASLLRHGLLFGSFGSRGIAPRLKARYGAERGFEIYEAAAALTLFVQRITFAGVLFATSTFVLPPTTVPIKAAIMAAGAVLLTVGVGVSIWATHRVGLDTYYYRDLFMGPRHVKLECEGAYAFTGSPVYGWGQLAGYGAALLAFSPEGLLAAALNQIALLAFNQSVEQPHLRDATRLMTEQDLRDHLARTLLEPDLERRQRGDGGWPTLRSVPPPRPRTRPSMPPPAPMASTATVLPVEVAQTQLEREPQPVQSLREGADGQPATMRSADLSPPVQLHPTSTADICDVDVAPDSRAA